MDKKLNSRRTILFSFLIFFLVFLILTWLFNMALTPVLKRGILGISLQAFITAFFVTLLNYWKSIKQIFKYNKK